MGFIVRYISGDNESHHKLYGIRVLMPCNGLWLPHCSPSSNWSIKIMLFPIKTLKVSYVFMCSQAIVAVVLSTT